MRKLIVHQPSNHQSKKFRYYNIFFENLINELSQTHDVVTNRYFKRANQGYNKIKLDFDDSEKDFTLETYECEMIIEDIETKEVFVFSVADDLTPTILDLQSRDNLKKVFIAQFIREKVYHHVQTEFRDKFHPWIYFPSNEYNFDFYFNKRITIENKINKLYFRGDDRSRPILEHFPNDVFFGGKPIGGFETYANELINYDVALSVAGRGELCYRDVECFAMGIPILRFEYLSELSEPLIPNYHYISVERPNDFKNWMFLDRNGGKAESKLLIDRFEEIKNDKDFLKFVSSNAKKYYDDYLSPKSSVQHTIKLMDL